MDFKYKQLEQELSALSKVFSELGARLSEVAKEVTAPGTMPSEKLLEQISASRTSFENARNAVHGHAVTMLVSPLPKLGELVSIATIDTLLKATAVAEETKFSIEGERERALAILGRVLSITHRESGDFKPLQESHAKIGELRNAVSNILWPHRHPESEAIVASKHPTTALLHFVENLDKLDDDSWMMLETTITETYGKPLFVAASRGKLEVRAEAKAESKPVAPAAAAAPVKPAEPAKPVVTEKPVEKKAVAEKAPEAPAAPVAATPAPEKKTVTPVTAAPAVPAAPAAPVAPAVAEKVQPKPIAPATPVVAPVAAAPVASAPTPEKKPVVAPAVPVAAAPPVVTPAVVTPVAAVPPQVAPVVAAAAPPRPPAPPVVAPAPVAAAPPVAATPPVAAAPPVVGAPSVLTHVPVSVPPAPAVPAPVAAATPTPASNGTPAGSPLTVTMNSLSALATATEPAEKKPVAAPPEAVDKQRKEPRLAAPAPPVSKPEPKAQEIPETAQQGMAGDGSQRPQRWGFWRGNR